MFDGTHGGGGRVDGARENERVPDLDVLIDIDDRDESTKETGKLTGWKHWIPIRAGIIMCGLDQNRLD